MALDDLTSLRALADGDPDAWRGTVARFRPLLRSVASRHRLAPHAAQDLEQRVWLLLLEHAPAIRDPVRLPGWLRTTASREALALLRHERREQPTADPAAVARVERAPDPAEAVADRDRHRRLHGAIGRLPQRQRAVVVALLHEDRGYRDVGGRLGMPVGSIGPTRARALARLRDEPSLAG